MHVENTIKLRDFLQDLYDRGQAGDRTSSFDMSQWIYLRHGDGHEITSSFNIHLYDILDGHIEPPSPYDCNTAGCMAGYCVLHLGKDRIRDSVDTCIEVLHPDEVTLDDISIQDIASDILGLNEQKYGEFTPKFLFYRGEWVDKYQSIADNTSELSAAIAILNDILETDADLDSRYTAWLLKHYTTDILDIEADNLQQR